MAFTLTTLKQAIQDYTESNETTFVNNLTTIITQAEDKIHNVFSTVNDEPTG